MLLFVNMSYVANKISEHLFQGGFPPGGDSLSCSGIDVLVLAAAEWQDASHYEGITVICAPGDDDSRRHRLDGFIKRWEDAADQVVEHVKAGRNVLVTCMAGQNRSGLIVGLALRKLTGWSGKQIVEHISSHRVHAFNNSTFANYLCERFPQSGTVL